MRNRNYWNLSKRMFLALWEEEKNKPIPINRFGNIPTDCANNYLIKWIGNWTVEIAHGSELFTSVTVINIWEKDTHKNICSLCLVYQPGEIRKSIISDTGCDRYKDIKKLFDDIIRKYEQYKEV